MSKIQYQQKPSTQSNDAPSQPNPERKQNQDRPYNNNRTYNDRNRNYNNDHSNGNYDRKPRYQDKQGAFKNKFGFVYDESKIGYNTEIPEMPEKLKQKPDEAKFNKKMEELYQKQTELKKIRKQKKNTHKNGNKSFLDEIENQKHNIQLGKACLIVLNFDLNAINTDLDDLEGKIAHHKRKADFLSKPAQKGPRNVEIDEMTLAEVLREEERINNEMSMRDHSKAQTAELLNRLNKLKKRKIEIPKQEAEKVEVSEDRGDEVSYHKNTVEKLKGIKANLNDRTVDIKSKIEAIEDDIADFEEAIEELHHKMKNTNNDKLLEEAKVLKEQIFAIQDEMKELEDQHKAKIYDYEKEQQQIKYIQWAKEIKAKKAEEWELEKQQKKRQRLKEKENKKKGDEKPGKQGETKPGETTEEKPFEKKKFNKNQKEIDSCAFLIQYCKDLNQGNEKSEQKQADSGVKLEEALKKGEWAKMKNVEVIKSKKTKQEDEVEQKNYRKRENKNPVVQPTDKFSHTYFVAQVFDSVKVLPPTKPEEIEKVIIELEDKVEYYLAHPDEGVERTLLPTKDTEKETKGRGPRRVINTEEFPSLK